jgi:ribosome biogenesis protein BMS1
MEPEERKAVALLQQIQALRKDKVVKRHDKKEEKRKEHRKEVVEREGKKDGKIKAERREVLRKEGIKRKRDEQHAEGGKRKR